MVSTMSEQKVKKLEKHSSTEREQVTASVQVMMREYSAVRWPTLNHKGRMARLAGVLGFGHRRVKSLYCAETGTAVRADEFAAIAALHQRKIEEANRNDFQALQARIARLEAALLSQDEGFHHEQVAALRASVDGRRGGYVAGADGSGQGRSVPAQTSLDS
jgi:hypothetical protein